LQGTGLFEDDWFEITDDVKKWGKIKVAIDAIRLNRLQFSPLVLSVSNESGRYNPEDNEASLWFGYLQQQRTLVKIEVGFVDQIQNDDGTWANTYFPGEPYWDEDYWDLGAEWDTGDPIAFKGVINGDIVLTDANEVSINVAPLLQVFRDFSARNLRGLDNSITASRFMTLLRDQTDGSGSFVFRPFFNDTTSTWDIATTTVIYSNLNTSTAADIRSMDVWEVVEKLAESENHVAFISRDGTFRFRPRDANTVTSAFDFFGGPGIPSSNGHTIKKISSYGKKQSKFYSRVEVKHNPEDTTTSFEIVEATLTVASNNAAWNLGQKTLEIENLWMTSTVAATVALSLFNDYSAVKNEIDFSTSLVPHLDILDRITVTYDASPISANSLWDQYDWAETMGAAETGQELIFDANSGEALKLSGDEFKFQSIEIDLDKLECKFSGREV
jgi:hypothetical protein